MPILLILGPIVGLTAIAIFVAHVSHRSAPAVSSVAGTATTQFELDRGMPEVDVHRVLTALVQDSDPTALDALARELSAKYPIAASEVRAKVAALGRPAASASPAAAAPRGAPARTPASSPPDMSEASLVLQAAMKAYAEETDPVTLEGFADSIRAKFPTGAILLFGRASELRAAHAGATATVSLPPAAEGGGSLVLPVAATAAAAAPALAPPPTAARYVVQAGDSPTVIAARLVRDEKRWPELVAANPEKPVSHGGTFASLRPGEALHLPPSWAAAPAQPPAVPAPHVEVPS